MKASRIFGLLIVFGVLVGCGVGADEEANKPGASVNALTGMSSQALTIKVTGGGEATAVPFVEFLGHDGVLRKIVTTPGEIGHRFTFGFNATKDENGTVRGQLQMVDHDAGIVLHSDVAVLRDHPIHQRPLGSLPRRPNGKSLLSSVGGVKLNGEPQPGWRLFNVPVYDGGPLKSGTGDVVCFEFRNPSGALVKEWIAFVTRGEVRIEE